MSFQDLPEDIVENIFLQLNPYGDIKNVSYVCHQWRRLAQGATQRARRMLHRCEKLDWFLLMPAPEQGKFSGNVAERCSHAAVYSPHNEAVYIFGGCTASYTTFNDLWRLDLAQRCWIRPVPSGDFPSPKACASLVEHKGKLILFGGWSKSSPNPIHQTSIFFNQLHSYCTETDTWKAIGSTAAAPHLAGHSASVVDDTMVVFGGSHGQGSTNRIWVFDFGKQEWSTPTTSSNLPLPRYGQSQINLDSRHILIIGGCGGPNLIFNDVWLLTISENPQDPWLWEEITVTNPAYSAPQIWSHPACKVGDKVIVLSRAVRGLSREGRGHRQMSLSRAGEGALGGGGVGARGGRGWVPPQGNLIPPRRKLITSRSLDEQNPPPSPKSDSRKTLELQRAQSIPAIIVGEIPKLVVTKEENSGDSSGSDSGAHGCEEGASAQCIAMVGSSLLPNQATLVFAAAGGDGACPTPAKREKNQPARPGKNRKKRLEMLRRMEEYIRSKSRAEQAAGSPGGSGASSGGSSPTQSSASGSPTLRLPPSSPPPRSKHTTASEFLQVRNPMRVYVLDVSKVLRERQATWRVLEECLDAPEDTILYSLVKARGELIMFGGMRSASSSEQQGLGVAPFPKTITNETYIIKPCFSL